LLNESTCCEVGKKPTAGVCATAVSIVNCVEWGTLEGDEVCLTCRTGFVPYNYRKAGSFETMCCADGTFLDPVSEKCINRNSLTNTNACDEFDVLHEASYYRLPLCIDIPAGSYVSNNFVCTDTNFFDAADSACDTINTTTYVNCD
jgi:hypothetical protein